jgi:hypothetical protein
MVMHLLNRAGRITLLLVGLVYSSFSLSEDVIQLEGISILGSTEDSRILTISSWKEVAEIDVITFRLIEGTQGENLFEPIHPAQFDLEVEYSKRLRTNAGKLLRESRGN